MTEDRLVYICTSKDGDSESRNYSTGTKIYERKINCLKRLWRDQLAVEYKLVPTGRKFNQHGNEVISIDDQTS